ncbi:hypothetical protein K490DRAFT_45822 [Saccharata proteae CBS 121410]|uniref:Conserved oligomeric Golgi complex subunit 1 n=1 Tax=Saccharata proteae CBS 121410 TaxID=1314787 RepID=A0A9P4HUY2_9PEZI|nr:hypothetical protein K490DRAFT_45822 [Saccharata proteae CBS 121410]
MTTEAPDPRSFTSWEDAFQYPIPVVRKLEQQLRNNANDNREKLRSLVGASYRDLLGTAERIIEMDGQMQDVETTLSLVGQKCNSRAIDRINKNYAALSASIQVQDRERYAFGAQLAVLQSSPAVIRRTLKKGHTLLAAKLLVISRLLHKTLSQSPDAPPIVDSIRDQLASLRRKLLRRIDKQFSEEGSDVSELLQSMCAFSLATTSTPSDVLRHFTHVRLETVTRLVDQGRLTQENLPQALRLYVRTLVDLQKIFPRLLAEALNKLKACPLLKDRDVQSVSELCLDIHEKWIAPEVRNYTPWPRHDELSRTDAEKFAKNWAKQAIDAFLNGLRSVLSDHNDPKVVSRLRTEMLEAWLSVSSRDLGVDPATVLDKLRDVLNERLRALLVGRSHNLSQVASELSGVLDDWKDNNRNDSESLWASSITSIDTSDGAPALKKAVISRSHGISDAVRQPIAVYEDWARSMEETQTVIKGMTESRWNDDLENDDDDIDLDSKQALLSEDDPRALNEALQESISAALVELREHLQQTVTQICSTQDGDSAAKAMVMLRVLREVSQRLSGFTASLKLPVSASQTFSAELTRPLHLAMANSVALKPVSSFKAALDKSSKSRNRAMHALWEGNPPIPVQPTPATFRLLHQLSKEMVARGSDLWSPDAVAVLKEELGNSLSSVLQEHVKTIERRPQAEESEHQANGNGEEKTATKGQEPLQANDVDAALRKEKLIQLFFDIAYLQRSLTRIKEPHRSSMAGLQEYVQTAVGKELDGAACERVRRNAADYWKRTYLLFALLS